MIGEIEEFIQNDKSPFYKLDQKQSNVWIQLFQRDNGKKDKDGKELKKLRKFKISMVSDRVVTEQEFKQWKRSNYIEFKKKDLDRAKI